MELEVGMYITTKNGIIRKWDKYDRLIKKWEERYNFKDNYDDLCFEVEKDIIKASYDIIDLIEVGDYVNGNKVIRIETSSYPEDKNVKIIVCCGDDDYYVYYKEEIKTILTKEQFENNCYNVEE